MYQDYAIAAGTLTPGVVAQLMATGRVAGSERLHVTGPSSALREDIGIITYAIRAHYRKHSGSLRIQFKYATGTLGFIVI